MEYSNGRLLDADIKSILDEKYYQYARRSFIDNDPISIPHQYSKLQDIEIVAFWTAILSWGQRTTIINKARELFLLMDNQPYDFVMHHSPSDLQKFEKFVHRTFQAPDTLYFIHFFHYHYNKYSSLEHAFCLNKESLKHRLEAFHDYFFNAGPHMSRTKKHVATPLKKSTCKRINMFLRWMVRPNKEGVDFGHWAQIPTSDLMIPFDVHVERAARYLGLLHRKQRDWRAVEEITSHLRSFDPNDPIKYDFALFGMGVLDQLN